MALIPISVVVLGTLLGAEKLPITSVKVVYDVPGKTEHVLAAEMMKQEHVLEDAAAMLSILKLPKLLTLQARSCGEANAWYDGETHVITFCYELVRDFMKMAESSGHFELSQDQAVIGPLLFVVFHETAHAVFHILAVPVLGPEEDAADQVAVFAATRFGGDFAERMLR